MDATDYAVIVSSVLPDSAALAALRVAAGNLDDAVRTGAAALDAAIDDYHRSIDALKAELIDSLLQAVPIQELRDQALAAGLANNYQLHAQAQLGSAVRRLGHPGCWTRRSAHRRVDRDRPMPPNAFQARLDAGPVTGNGALVVSDNSIGGLLSARVGVIEVAALASLARTAAGGPSFLAVLSAGFTPGLQLGFGFQIGRIGGLIGIERSISADAIKNRLKDGTAAAVFFPLDAGNAARAALQAADQMFPPTPGS